MKLKYIMVGERNQKKKKKPTRYDYIFMILFRMQECTENK